jgi:hypothetical protein
MGGAYELQLISRYVPLTRCRGHCQACWNGRRQQYSRAGLFGSATIWLSCTVLSITRNSGTLVGEMCCRAWQVGRGNSWRVREERCLTQSDGICSLLAE